MVIYLDNSFLNRPFDDPDKGINKLESELLSLVFKLANEGKVDMVNSSVIKYENSLNPIPERKVFVEEIIKQAKIHQNVDEDIRDRAENLAQITGLSPIDALHLASAESANADVFITCDYDIIKQYKRSFPLLRKRKGKVKVITPLEFIQYYEHSNK